MSSRTHQEDCEEFIRLLAGFTPQAIVELDQPTLEALRDRLGSLSVVLLEEHLWRVASGAWPFPLDGDGHEAAALAVREVTADLHLHQQCVVDLSRGQIHEHIAARLGARF